MFAYRQDLLKALIADNVRLVVLGRDERLSDLPEFRNDEVRADADLLARYLEYSPRTKLLVVGEESLLGDPGMAGVGDSHLVRMLAHAIHQVAGTRPVDPEWENRPRHIWQQYELRVKRLDVHFDEKLKELYQQAMSDRKWQGTSAVQGRASYWTSGVLAYFDAAGQNGTPMDSVRAIETREQLAAYDPGLYALVNQTMAYDHRVDWRLNDGIK
jgi:hypothetical protein